MAGIEVLRFLAALAILVWHYQHLFFVGAWDGAVAGPMRPQFPFYDALSLFYEHGAAAVEVFWVISGFVFMRRYYDAITRQTISFEDFAVRRFSRLYPLHIVTLVAVIVLQHAYQRLHPAPFIYQDDTAAALFAQLFMASNWFAGQDMTFNGPIWSVSVEVLVYCLFYAVLWPIGIEAIKSPLSKASIAAMALALLSMIVPVFNTAVLTCGTFFLCGCLAERVSGDARAVRISVAALGSLIAVAVSGFGGAMPEGLVVFVLAVSATLVAAHLDAWVPAFVLGRASRLGNTTYSSYLLHFPLQIAAVIVVDSLGVSRAVFFHPLVFCCFIGSTFALATATYHWFEVPAQRWLRAAWRAGFGERQQASV